MHKPRHAHSDLIDAIGPAAIRGQFRLSHQRLHAWRKRGIPRSHRPAVAQLAMLQGKSVPGDFLLPPESAAA